MILLILIPNALRQIHPTNFQSDIPENKVKNAMLFITLDFDVRKFHVSVYEAHRYKNPRRRDRAPTPTGKEYK